MHLFTHPAAHALSLALILVPLASSAPQRSVGDDLSSLRKAECSYRGITATYEEVTTAYILENYAGGHCSVARPTQSSNPDSETPLRPLMRSKAPPRRSALYRPSPQQCPPNIDITWRYSSLAAVRIDPANDYARDALESFTHTVDSFIVVWLSPLKISRSPLNPMRCQRKGGSRIPRNGPTRRRIRERWIEVRQPSSLVSGHPKPLTVQNERIRHSNSRPSKTYDMGATQVYALRGLCSTLM